MHQNTTNPRATTNMRLVPYTPNPPNLDPQIPHTTAHQRKNEAERLPWASSRLESFTEERRKENLRCASTRCPRISTHVTAPSTLLTRQPIPVKSTRIAVVRRKGIVQCPC
jgi:hypothetical protein